MLSRYSSRYPTIGEGSQIFGSAIANATTAGDFNATGELTFLNSWTYPLSGNILTPVGQLE